MKLPRDQALQIHKALQEAFPSYKDLMRMVQFGLGENLQTITEGTNLNDAVAELITWACACDRIEELLAAAKKYNSSNKSLNVINLAASVPEIIQIPFVILAMNRKEAERLENGQAFEDDYSTPAHLNRYNLFKTALKTQEMNMDMILECYGTKRDDWKPHKASGNTVEEVVRTILNQINERVKHKTPNALSLHPKFVSELFFTEESAVRIQVWNQLRSSGCILIADAVSLFHPRLHNLLMHSTIGADSTTSVVVFSPVGWKDLPVNRVIDEELGPKCMEVVFNRFNEQLDWRCEFSVSDLRSLKRWLAITIPETERNLQNPSANQQALQTMYNFQGKEQGFRGIFWGNDNDPEDLP